MNFQEQRQRVSQLVRALRFVWQSARGSTVASGVLLVVQGTLPLVPLYLMKLIVDAATALGTAPDQGVVLRKVLWLVVLMGAVSLIGALLRSIFGLVNESQTLSVTDHMSAVLHAKSVEVDLEYYESASYHDTLHRAQREAPYRPTHLMNGLVRVGQNAISLLAVAGLLLSFHWSVAVLLLAAALPGVAVRLAYVDAMYRSQREQTKTVRRADYFNWMLTGASHAKEVRLFALGPVLMSRFRDFRLKLREERLGIAVRRSAAELAAQTGATALCANMAETPPVVQFKQQDRA